MQTASITAEGVREGIARIIVDLRQSMKKEYTDSHKPALDFVGFQLDGTDLVEIKGSAYPSGDDVAARDEQVANGKWEEDWVETHLAKLKQTIMETAPATCSAWVIKFGFLSDETPPRPTDKPIVVFHVPSKAKLKDKMTFSTGVIRTMPEEYKLKKLRVDSVGEITVEELRDACK